MPQGKFLPSLVLISQDVTEKKSFENFLRAKWTQSDGNISQGLWPGELKIKIMVSKFVKFYSSPNISQLHYISTHTHS